MSQPDTILLDSQFVPHGAASILVTPTSGSQATLGAALATAQVTGGAISGATINSSVIGGTTPAAGTFTTLGATTFTGTTIDGVVGSVTPAAATFTNMGTTGYARQSVGNTLTAAGTTRTDALALAAQVNNITTAASSTGAVLPTAASVGVGCSVVVFNNGANAIKMYAAGSETIDGTAGATGVTLTNTKRCAYVPVSTTAWLSYQLGAVSA